MKKRRRTTLVIVICAAVFLVAGSALALTLYLRHRAALAREALAEAVVVTVSVPEHTTETGDAKPKDRPEEPAAAADPYAWDGRGATLEIDFSYLLAENADTIGWLHIPALDISYPVMQSEDNEYYLDKGFDLNYDENGSVFAEYTNSSDFSDMHTFLYGHNTVDGTLFGRLHEFGDVAGTFERDDSFYIYMPDGSVSRYTICSFYSTDKTSNTYVVFDTDDAYDYYTDLISSQSVRKLDYSFANRPPIVTLSTCYGAHGTSTRYVVHGMLTGRYER